MALEKYPNVSFINLRQSFFSCSDLNFIMINVSERETSILFLFWLVFLFSNQVEVSKYFCDLVASSSIILPCSVWFIHGNIKIYNC